MPGLAATSRCWTSSFCFSGPATTEIYTLSLHDALPISGGRCRRVMEQETRMPAEPGAHLGVLVAAVVVEDDVHDLPGWDLGLESVEKPDELLMPVALHAAADDLTFEHVERGKQGRRAVALVIVGHRPAPAGLQRQPGLGPVERLNLRFLVDRQHHDIEPDDVVELGG